MTYRSLAIACFTHLNRKDEAVKLMEKARSLNCSQQVLYESAILMDLMGAPAAEKIALLEPTRRRLPPGRPVCGAGEGLQPEFPAGKGIAASAEPCVRGLRGRRARHCGSVYVRLVPAGHGEKSRRRLGRLLRAAGKGAYPAQRASAPASGTAASTSPTSSIWPSVWSTWGRRRTPRPFTG